MSSNDDEPSSYYKKRKVLRACDVCRRKKSYEAVAPETRCANCVTQNLKCTYESEPRKRGRPGRYTEVLERRLKILEGIVKSLCPDRATLHSLVSPLDPEYALLLTNAPVESSVSALSPFATPPSEDKPAEKTQGISVLDLIHKVTSLTLNSKEDPFRDDDVELSVRQEYPMSGIGANSLENRFWGKSSGIAFMSHALLEKVTVQSKESPVDADVTTRRRILQNRRPFFWAPLPWNTERSFPTVTYTFPPPDLIPVLVDAYFEHMNLLFPLLHRPTFERNLENKLHLRREDDGFARVFLLVCAVGARFAKELDKRSLSDGVDPQYSAYSAGWKWYNQVQVINPSLLEPPKLYDLQVYCLAIEFLTGFSPPQTVWLLAGMGIRLAQDVGVHRRRVPRDKLTVEDELWKRAFWVLIAVDRMVSMGIGRPCAIFDDSFDLDMPVECDDDYWEHPDPEKRFKQPDGIPSTVTAFVLNLQLTKIMTFAMRTIYTIKTKFWNLILQEWEQHIVSEIDSALNNWISSLPEYLRWDPDRVDEQFFKLSGSLITTYYFVQIVVHRPYAQLGVASKNTPLAFSSLAICTNAARSCALILDQQRKRLPVVYPFMQMAAMGVVVLLLVNVWGNKRKGLPVDKRGMMQVEMCMNVLRKGEERWYVSGTAVDILNELASAGELDSHPKIVDGHNVFSVSPENELSSFDFPLSSESLPMLQNQQYPVYNTTGPQISYMPAPSNGLLGSTTSLFTQDPSYNPFNTQTSSFATSGASLYTDTGSSSTFNFPPNMNFTSPMFQQETVADSNTMAVWLNAPNGLELDEWNSFLANFSELTGQLQSGDPYSLDELQGSNTRRS